MKKSPPLETGSDDEVDGVRIRKSRALIHLSDSDADKDLSPAQVHRNLESRRQGTYQGKLYPRISLHLGEDHRIRVQRGEDPIQVWDLDTSRLSLRAKERPWISLAEKKLIACAHPEGEIRFRSQAKGTCLATLRGLPAGKRLLGFRAAGDEVWVAVLPPGGRGTLLFRASTLTGEILAEAQVPRRLVAWVEAPEPTPWIAASEDGALWVLDPEGNPLSNHDLETPYAPLSLALGPEGSGRLASLDGEGRVEVWNLEDLSLGAEVVPVEVRHQRYSLLWPSSAELPWVVSPEAVRPLAEARKS